jgi:hypothetical protein
MMQARSRLYQMSREAVPKGVRACRFRYAGAFLGVKEDLSYRTYTDMSAFLLPFK